MGDCGKGRREREEVKKESLHKAVRAHRGAVHIKLRVHGGAVHIKLCAHGGAVPSAENKENDLIERGARTFRIWLKGGGKAISWELEP